MRHSPKTVLSLTLAIALLLPGQPAWSRIDPEDQKLIDAASCAEIVREYRNYSNAEREAEAAIKRSAATNAAVNIAGLAALATLGFGAFHWNSNADAQENLRELRDIRVAIGEGAKKKKCQL